MKEKVIFFIGKMQDLKFYLQSIINFRGGETKLIEMASFKFYQEYINNSKKGEKI